MMTMIRAAPSPAPCQAPRLLPVTTQLFLAAPLPCPCPALCQDMVMALSPAAPYPVRCLLLPLAPLLSHRPFLLRIPCCRALRHFPALLATRLTRSTGMGIPARFPALKPRTRRPPRCRCRHLAPACPSRLGMATTTAPTTNRMIAPIMMGAPAQDTHALRLRIRLPGLSAGLRVAGTSRGAAGTAPTWATNFSMFDRFLLSLISLSPHIYLSSLRPHFPSIRSCMHDASETLTGFARFLGRAVLMHHAVMPTSIRYHCQTPGRLTRVCVQGLTLYYLLFIMISDLDVDVPLTFF